MNKQQVALYYWRQSIMIAGLSLLLAGSVRAEFSCHIHPATTAAEKSSQQQPQTVGNFKDMKSCEEENQRRYLGKARCHCGFSSSLNKPMPGAGEERAAPFNRQPPSLP